MLTFSIVMDIRVIQSEIDVKCVMDNTRFPAGHAVAVGRILTYKIVFSLSLSC